MTVTYTGEVSTCTGFSPFIKLLARWRGSIYKIVWVDLLFFLGFYYFLKIIYVFLLEGSSKGTFEKIVRYCDKYASLIPLSFVLGFYVSLVMTRWWNQYSSIPFPDNLAILVGANIKGQDDRTRIVRRTIMRYVCLTFTITLTMVSSKVKKRFPTHVHFIEAGLMTRDEKKIIQDLDNEFPSYSKYWLPLAWAANVVTRARHEGLIRDDEAVKMILDEINHFRAKCGTMLDYDWISVPLVYTQVVTLAVYAYFIVSAFGKQYIGNAVAGEEIELYFPFLSVFEYFFYVGWLKVAETLINPYGDDDDDFEVVWMIDRHLQVCYLIVDKIHQEHPRLMKDRYWAETAPNSLPYTLASQDYMKEYPMSSTLNVNVKKNDQDLIMLQDPSQPDGGSRSSGAHILWKGLQTGTKKRKGSKKLNEMPLKKVVSFPPSQDVDGMEEVNEYETALSQPKKTVTAIMYCEEFENLRHQRMEEHKRRIQAIIELMKK